MYQRIIGVDPGENVSGICILDNAQIIGAFNEENTTLYDKVSEFFINGKSVVVIEDIHPSKRQLSTNVINTCKFIGELCYRLKVAGTPYILIPRSKVKNWVFKSFPSVSIPRITKSIELKSRLRVKKGLKPLRYKDGSPWNPSFVFVDDRIVIAAMKELYNIPTPKPGKTNIYGINDHAWQALAVLSCYIHEINKVNIK